MKEIIKFMCLFACLVCLGALSSCKKDFLEINPKGMLIAGTTKDYDRALNSLDFVNQVNAWGSGAAQVLLGDEVVAVDPYFSGTELRTQRLFKWEAEIYQPSEDALEMDVPMKNLYAYNKIINEVMDSKGGSEATKRSIQAEAKVGRALIYFMLINYYGKPYDASLAATDPGFPIITEADATQTKFVRSSVKEVYDFIVADLKAALEVLPHHITNRLRFAQPTAAGLLAKVYMFMGDYKSAMPLFKQCMDGLAGSGIPVKLYDYNIEFSPGGAFYPVGLFGPANPAFTDNKENLLARQFSNFWCFVNNEIVISAKTAALYGPEDRRRNYFSNRANGGSVYPNGFLRRIGPLTSQIGIVLPDLYLLEAECQARLSELPEAVKTLETFRKNRMPEAVAGVPEAVATDQHSLVAFILEERIREFAVTGYRWFDMRRLSVDPEYKNLVGLKHEVYGLDGNVVSTFDLSPERFTLRFAQKLMLQNPDMENNP